VVDAQPTSSAPRSLRSPQKGGELLLP
jgi:hypothetical protein